MAWEKFTITRRSFKPRISIRGNSQIGFNSAAIEDFKLKDYKFAVLYYDRDNKKIGVKLTNSKEEEGVRKLRVREGAGASLPARVFIEYYKMQVRGLYFMISVLPFYLFNIYNPGILLVVGKIDLKKLVPVMDF